MEMAARGTGGGPVTRLAPVHRLLFGVALLLACACVVGGVLVVREATDDDAAAAADAPSVEEQDRYGDVRRAAEATATALVNIDYRKPEESFEAVAATATGTFLDQYQASSDSLVELVKAYQSVLVGKVAVSAVDTVDADSASVLVATEGTVRNAETDQDVVRNFRLRITLVRQDDAWLANDLEFVG